jgi:8-oxo-dGTP pyrophosphatase MutT (NUDIX family)
MTTASSTTHGTMRDARLAETEVLLPKPKRFVREALVMPDGYELDWYYVDTPPSVMVVPVTADGALVLVRQYRYNLKRYALEFPAGTTGDDEDPAGAALRELEEETGFKLAPGGQLRRLGSYYSLPSETNKYTHIFVAEPAVPDGPARGDTEIEKYFDMSVVVMSFSEALDAIGDTICGTETVTALMLAHRRGHTEGTSQRETPGHDEKH